MERPTAPRLINTKADIAKADIAKAADAKATDNTKAHDAVVRQLSSPGKRCKHARTIQNVAQPVDEQP
jgi:hypothetical protein